MVAPSQAQAYPTRFKSFLASGGYSVIALILARIDAEFLYRQLLVGDPLGEGLLPKTPAAASASVSEGLGFAVAIIAIFWLAHALALILTDRRWRSMSLRVRLMASGICGAGFYLLFSRGLIPAPSFTDDP